jgi:ferritin-like metal-binding protein YciE
MTDHDAETQLVKYLTDVHSIEEQALTQMRRAPDLVEGDFSAIFQRHLAETESQERRVRERLEAHEASPSTPKDLAGKAGGFGMVLFARMQPDTPAKLALHAFSYEHMEVAAYELLTIAAREAGDAETAAMAEAIAGEEREMAGRIAERFDEAVEQALREVEPDDLDEQLDSYLSDVHALEGQSKQMLEKGKEMDVPEPLRGAFEHHLAETEGHLRKIEQRLEQRGASPSAIEDAALRLGAGWPSGRGTPRPSPSPSRSSPRRRAPRNRSPASGRARWPRLRPAASPKALDSQPVAASWAPGS